MGIINIVQNVKEIHKEYVIIVKVGNFYYCYGKDCYIISYLLKYKMNVLKDNVYSCSFPQSAINKVMYTLEKSKVNYIILDRRNNYQIEEKNSNRNLNQYSKMYEIAKIELSSKMRIEKIYNYLQENIKEKELINEIEKVINERRKV